MTENKPDPLKSLLVNHDVFPLAPHKLDVLYSALKAYVETREKEIVRKVLTSQQESKTSYDW